MTLHGETLQTTILRVERVNCALGYLGAHAEQLRNRCHGEQVIHHVRRRLRRRDAPAFTVFRSYIEGQALIRQTNFPSSKIELRTRKPAGRTGKFTQMGILAISVTKHATALLARLRKRGIAFLGKTACHAFGNTEGNLSVRSGIRNGRAHGVIGVVHEHGFLRGLQRAHNALLHAIDLAETVELIAEQVQKHNMVRFQMRKDAGYPQFVRLEYAPLSTLGLQQRRRNTPTQIRTGAIACDGLSRSLQGIGQKVRHGCLAVGANNQNGAFLQARSEARKQVGVDLERVFSRHGGAIAVHDILQAPRQQRPRCLCRRKLQSHNAPSPGQKTARP